jgi:hypothetical protein
MLSLPYQAHSGIWLWQRRFFYFIRTAPQGLCGVLFNEAYITVNAAQSPYIFDTDGRYRVDAERPFLAPSAIYSALYIRAYIGVHGDAS